MTVESDDGLIAGRYRRLGHIGAGGMARVYLAEDEKLGRKVAVKRLHSDSPDDAASRFEREARLGASLNHPNLVSVYDIETEPESVLIVMEYVEGQTLREAIADGPLGIEQAISVARDIGAALDHAHSHGVIHRDVKPANILIRRDGVAKLADLGIAKAAESTQLTGTGMLVGTASYMAPEQLDGSSAGPATDVYALAAVMYEALGGEKARDGSTPVEIAHQVATNPAPDLRSEWENAPAGAAEVLKRGMARDPAERPESAGRLARDLEEGLRGGVTAATVAEPRDDTDRTVALPVTAPPRPKPPPRRPAPPSRPAPAAPVPVSRKRGLPAWLPVAALLAVLAVAAIAVLASGGDDPAPQQSADGGGSAREEQPRQPTEEQPAEPAPEEEVADTGGGNDPAEGARLDAQAYSLIQQGKYQEAVPVARRAVASFPEDDTSTNYAYALFNLGTALNRSGSPEEAIPLFEKRLGFSDNQRDVVEAELADAREKAG
ncbi:MAG: serine/threonine-protein kinase [Actinomycetota bacterium]